MNEKNKREKSYLRTMVDAVASRPPLQYLNEIVTLMSYHFITNRIKGPKRWEGLRGLVCLVQLLGLSIKL